MITSTRMLPATSVETTFARRRYRRNPPFSAANPPQLFTVPSAWAASVACDAVRRVEQCQENDVLELKTTAGTVEHLQVVQGWDAASCSAVLLRKGQLLRLAAAAADGSGSLQLAALGSYPAGDSLVISSFPELSNVLANLHSHAVGDAPVIESVQVVDSLQHLQEQVTADAAFWRDGTAPGDPIKTDLQQALFTAGELSALLVGQRGIALVQLWNGWDASKGQPIYNPLALHMLERVLEAPGVGHCSSVAPGGVGLTAVLYADREPFAAWAAHLASFGCQANAVAGSAYYKLLIGQLLGYKLANVVGYVAASGEPPSAQLQQQVAQDIKRLSKVKPKLPWSAADTNIRKPKASASTGKAAAAGSKGTSGAGFSSSKGFNKAR